MLCHNAVIEKKTGSKDDIYAEFYRHSHTEGCYAAYIRGKRCKTNADFLRESSAAFQFPAYFGENWNAWDECICDLDWLQFSSLALIIDDYASVFSNEPNAEQERCYLERYLSDMQRAWAEQNVPVHIILFSE